MFTATRIDVPAYSRKPEIWFHHMRLSSYEQIQSKRDKLLYVVQQEVEAYLSTPDLVYESDEGFPCLERLTGEYYIADESYKMHVNPVWYEIGVQTHFLEKHWAESQDDFDYLGLQVWVCCDPQTWQFSVFGNTDSSVI